MIVFIAAGLLDITEMFISFTIVSSLKAVIAPELLNS